MISLNERNVASFGFQTTTFGFVSRQAADFSTFMCCIVVYCTALQCTVIDCLVLYLGSPFQYTVGQLTTGGGHKLQVGGPGLERGEVNMESRYTLFLTARKGKEDPFKL